MFCLLARPMESSITITGRPSIIKKSTYKNTNAAPPYRPVIKGKRHTFPSPIAHPAESKMNPSLLANVSRGLTALILLEESLFLLILFLSEMKQPRYSKAV